MVRDDAPLASRAAGGSTAIGRRCQVNGDTINAFPHHLGFASCLGVSAQGSSSALPRAQPVRARRLQEGISRIAAIQAMRILLELTSRIRVEAAFLRAPRPPTQVDAFRLNLFTPLLTGGWAGAAGIAAGLFTACGQCIKSC